MSAVNNATLYSDPYRQSLERLSSPVSGARSVPRITAAPTRAGAVKHCLDIGAGDALEQRHEFDHQGQLQAACDCGNTASPHQPGYGCAHGDAFHPR